MRPFEVFFSGRKAPKTTGATCTETGENGPFLFLIHLPVLSVCIATTQKCAMQNNTKKVRDHGEIDASSVTGLQENWCQELNNRHVKVFAN